MQCMPRGLNSNHYYYYHYYIIIIISIIFFAPVLSSRGLRNYK